ncbi:MAG: hypothetical protein AAGH48_00010 [Pseudomonadota bacterium]
MGNGGWGDEGLWTAFVDMLAQPSWIWVGVWAFAAIILYVQSRLRSLPRRDKSRAIVVGRRLYHAFGWASPLRIPAQAAFFILLALSVAAAGVQIGQIIGG